MTHLDYIEQTIGPLSGKKILDVGSGKGIFLLECFEKGYSAEGLEFNPRKIERSIKLGNEHGVSFKVKQGRAEEMPYNNASFDFANVSEVIEHVQDPQKVLKEVYRILKPDGSAYISVHNRFGLKDRHFHVYFLGWMPRFLGGTYLSLLGKHKDYKNMVDCQDIKDMHYFTFGNFKRSALSAGFKVRDIRGIKIKKRYGTIAGKFVNIVYKRIFRPIYFSTFHCILTK